MLVVLQTGNRRLGPAGISQTALLQCWRPRAPQYAGIADLSAHQTAKPIGGAAALWYGELAELGATLGTTLDGVVTALVRVNRVLGAVAAVAFIFAVVWVRRRLKR